MKTYIKYSILSLGLLFSATSCVDDFKLGDASLEKAPGVEMSIDSVFSRKDYAEKFLWNAYSNLFYGLNTDWSSKGSKMNMGLAESLSDIFQSYLSWDDVTRYYYTGKYNSSESGAHDQYSYTGESSWQGIRAAYVFLENVGRVPDMDQPTKDRLSAEAKMIIACLYTDMFRHYGGLPILKKAFKPTDDMNVPRATVQETETFILGLCNDALGVLPWSLPEEEVSLWDGRFTGAAALGLKIRVMLFCASPLFNDDAPYKEGDAASKLQAWYGKKDPQRWEDVVTACELFLKMNNEAATPKYDLVGGGDRTAFQKGYLTRGNGEVLISTRVRYKTPGHKWDASYYFLQSVGYSSAVPTLEYSEMFNNADGTPFKYNWGDKNSGSGEFTTDNPFKNRDPRMYETIISHGDEYAGRKIELWFGGQDRGTSTTAGKYFNGLGLYKFILDETKCLNMVAHWPYLRLPEIYLSYAEALNEVGRPGDAIEWLNKVRARVRLGGLLECNPGVNYTGDKELLREEILNERAREFGLEDVRWFDLVRWKKSENFKKRLHGLYITQETQEELNNKGELIEKPTGRYKFQKFTIVQRAWQNGDNGENNFDAKWYLSAFPLTEMHKNYGLTQNPGW